MWELHFVKQSVAQNAMVLGAAYLHSVPLHHEEAYSH